MTGESRQTNARKRWPKPLVAGCAVAVLVTIAVAWWLGATAYAFYHGLSTQTGDIQFDKAAPTPTVPATSNVSYSVSDVTGGSDADRAQLNGKSLTVTGYVTEIDKSGIVLSDNPALKSDGSKGLNTDLAAAASKVGAKVEVTGTFDAKSITLRNASLR